MKTKKTLSAGLTLLMLLFAIFNYSAAENKQNKKVTVVTASELSDFATTLTEKYSEYHPDAEFDFHSVESSELQNWMDRKNVVCLTGQPDDYRNNSTVKITIGRDIIVPVIHKNNPFSEKLNLEGVKCKSLTVVLKSDETKTWGQIIGNEDETTAPVFIADNAISQSVLCGFFNTEQQVLKNNCVFGEANELIDAVRNNPGAIGFFNLNDVLDSENNRLKEGLKFLPIDRNENGKIDYTENIYTDLNSFKRGVWIGKYPHGLVHNIYAVVPENNENGLLTGFVSWVLTDGQQYLEPSGHTQLVYSERPSKLEKINQPPLIIEPAGESKALTRLVLFILAFLIGLGILLHVIKVLHGKKTAMATAQNQSDNKGLFNIESLKIPGGLFYDKTHTWVFMERDGNVRVGIDDFIQHITGEFTRVKTKTAGEKVKKNDKLITLVRDGKQIDIYAPVSGTVKAVNEKLDNVPGYLNKSPYEKGWVCLIEPANWLREIGFLKMAQQYKDWINQEFTRLRDFLAEEVNPKLCGQLVYQDGGEICDAVLQDLDPEIWEDFQKKFIDTSKM